MTLTQEDLKAISVLLDEEQRKWIQWRLISRY